MAVDNGLKKIILGVLVGGYDKKMVTSFSKITSRIRYYVGKGKREKEGKNEWKVNDFF